MERGYYWVIDNDPHEGEETGPVIAEYNGYSFVFPQIVYLNEDDPTLKLRDKERVTVLSQRIEPPVYKAAMKGAN
jgi:hypothetical protein